METPKKPKPFMRGRFHEGAAFVSAGASLVLFEKCHDLVSVISIIIYTLSLIGLFTISGLYHRIQWDVAPRAVMRRLDHAAIFALIAGTMTPFFLLALPKEQNVQAITLIWVVAGAGICQSIFWSKAPKWLAAIFYVITGWLVMPYFSEIKQVIGHGNSVLIVFGGVIYTVGAVIYATKKPDPWPKYFGYHEIFHILVVVGAFAHFFVINELLKLLG
jgi:hemolysin III